MLGRVSAGFPTACGYTSNVIGLIVKLLCYSFTPKYSATAKLHRWHVTRNVFIASSLPHCVHAKGSGNNGLSCIDRHCFIHVLLSRIHYVRSKLSYMYTQYPVWTSMHSYVCHKCDWWYPLGWGPCLNMRSAGLLFYLGCCLCIRLFLSNVWRVAHSRS